MEEKECGYENCENKFTSFMPTKKYCCKKCAKKADYRRNKQTYVDYEKKNRKKINKKALERYHKNKEQISERRKELYQENREKECQRVKKYKLANLEKVKEYNKGWAQNYKPIRNSKHRERYKEDELYKLRFNMRTRLRGFLRDKGWDKECETAQLIGCSYEELKIHLEKQFTEGMTWGKFKQGAIHVDHIVPLASAKTKEDINKLCHKSNLQPLWAEDNLKKGAKY